jgi:ribosomal protein L37AE/L43A
MKSEKINSGFVFIPKPVCRCGSYMKIKNEKNMIWICPSCNFETEGEINKMNFRPRPIWR